MVKKKLSNKDEKYVRTLKNRFMRLEDKETNNTASMDDYEEMDDIRKELKRLGFGDWHF